MSLDKKGFKYIHDIMDYSLDLFMNSDITSLSAKDILGFEPPKDASVFLPYIKCVPIPTLLPLYDTLTVGLPKIEKISQIKTRQDLLLTILSRLPIRKDLCYISTWIASCV